MLYLQLVTRLYYLCAWTFREIEQMGRVDSLDKAVDLSIVRLTNFKAIWNYIHVNKSATIPQISKAIGLSLPTVTRAVYYGVNAGILCEEGIVGAPRGRKAQSYALARDYMHFLLLSIDTADLRFKVHDFRSSTIREGIMPVDDGNVMQCIDSVVSECIGADEKIAMIAISLTGVISNDEVINSGAFPSLNGVRLREKLENETGRTVLLDNDMRIAALAALSYGSHMAQGISVAFLFGRRIHGVGILIDGKVMYGTNGAEGELDDVPICIRDNSDIRLYSDYLCAVIALLNPKRIILYARDDDLTAEMLIEESKKHIRPYAMPEFIEGRNIENDFFLGLSISCKNKIKELIAEKIK